MKRSILAGLAALLLTVGYHSAEAQCYGAQSDLGYGRLSIVIDSGDFKSMGHLYANGFRYGTLNHIDPWDEDLESYVTYMHSQTAPTTCTGYACANALKPPVAPEYCLPALGCRLYKSGTYPVKVDPERCIVTFTLCEDNDTDQQCDGEQTTFVGHIAEGIGWPLAHGMAVFQGYPSTWWIYPAPIYIPE